MNKRLTALAISAATLLFPQEGTGNNDRGDWYLIEEACIGNRPGFDGTFGELDLYGFSKVYRDNFVFFANGMGYLQEQDDNGGSVGIGTRCFFRDMLLGANVYYDFQHAGFGDVNQLGVGLELFTSGFEIRANFYLPDQRQLIGNSILYDDYIGDFAINSQIATYVAQKIDFEIGKRFCLWERANVFVGIGGYSLNFKGSSDAFGGSARIRLSYLNNIYIEGDAYYDRKFNMNAEIKIGIMQSLCELCRPINCSHQPVIRNYRCSTRCFVYETNY